MQELAGEPKPSFVVKTPSGAQLELQTKEEVDFYKKLVKQYEKDFQFTNVSDILELERLVAIETNAFRWQIWQSKGTDYDDDPVPVDHVKKWLSDVNKDILAIKSALGVDRKTRDKDKGANLSEYLLILKNAAAEQGVVRNKQAVAAISMLRELFGIVTLHSNYTEDQRTEFHMHEEDVIKWIKLQKEIFDKIDAEWRQGSQRYYKRDL